MWNVQPRRHVLTVDYVGGFLTSQHLRSETKQVIPIKLWDGAQLLHRQAHEFHDLNFLARAQVPQIVCILYPNFQEFGDDSKFGCQKGVGGILYALDHMVNICRDIHPESARNLLLVVDGLETQFLHRVGGVNHKPKLFIQPRIIFLQILVNQRDYLDLTQILFYV